MSNDFEGHGYRVGDVSLNVGLIPGRKRPALYRLEGSKLWPLAYFKNAEFAREALRLIDRIAEGEVVGERVESGLNR